MQVCTGIIKLSRGTRTGLSPGRPEAAVAKGGRVHPRVESIEQHNDGGHLSVLGGIWPCACPDGHICL